jgi:DNA-binding NarL/FixJ family response regulator
MPSDVLVVDDDASFRALVMRMLESAGVRVVGEADTAGGAMKAVLDLRPAAVLLDVGLPDGDGIELAGELVALPWKPRVVLTSSDAGAATAADVDRSGAAAFIGKQELTDRALRKLFAAP